MSLSGEYTTALDKVKQTALKIIAREQQFYAGPAGEAGQSDETGCTDQPSTPAEGMAALQVEVDALASGVMNLPGSDEESYRFKFLLLEALEDLRQSLHEHLLSSPAEQNSSTNWASKRAAYLLKIHYAEEALGM